MSHHAVSLKTVSLCSVNLSNRLVRVKLKSLFDLTIQSLIAVVRIKRERFTGLGIFIKYVWIILINILLLYLGKTSELLTSLITSHITK